jgi:hypothetical protein
MFMGLGLSMLMSFTLANAGDEEFAPPKKENVKLTRQECRLERERKREQRKIDREKRKQERLAKKENRIEDKKSERSEDRKLERERKKEQKRLDKEKREQERLVNKQKGAEKHKTPKAKKEKRVKKSKKTGCAVTKKEKENARMERKDNAKLEKIHAAEKKKVNKINEENKSKAKKEQHRLKKQQMQEQQHMALLKEQKERADKLAKITTEKAANLKLAKNWQEVRSAAVETDFKNGKYADLYMLPAWPVTNWFFKDKALINISGIYEYATDAYDSDGASRDLTTLEFGESPVRVQDIFLASKLLNEGKVASKNLHVADPEEDLSFRSPVDFLLKYYGDRELKFNGRSEKAGFSLDFMRHVLRDDISIGIQVPVLFMKNRLDMNIDFPIENEFYSDSRYESRNFQLSSGEGQNNVDVFYPDQDVVFAELESHLYHEALMRMFKAKGITELGGSAAGLGDITLFGNVEVTTKWIDKIVAGLKVVLPTGRKATPHKLWAPELGNGGCTEFAAFVSLLVKYNRYINPHLSLQAGLNTTCHVNKHVPGWVTSGADVPETGDISADLMALADRLQYNGNTFAGWDSAIRGFGDKAISVKYEKGPEITARIGDVIDKFLFRRGFLDIFYNIRVKAEDCYRQANRDEYRLDMFEDNTQQVEHRIGIEYSYQFDNRSRMKAGFIYTFAGTNVPKTFDLGVSFAHSF